jgi:formate hydrogenlyase subunit 4
MKVFLGAKTWIPMQVTATQVTGHQCLITEIWVQPVGSPYWHVGSQRTPSFGMWCSANLVRAYVSEVRVASVFRIEKIC